MPIDDGGPAFAVQGTFPHPSGGTVFYDSPGMSYRWWLFGTILGGLGVRWREYATMEAVVSDAMRMTDLGIARLRETERDNAKP